jgi:glycosyltransferase involved in cell wall biosynthesis
MLQSNKILFFLKLPPPTTGATLMNQYVAESQLLKDNFEIHIIGISYNNSVSQMGSYSLTKFVKIIKYKAELLKELIKFKPDLIYFQISPHGIAFLRDLIFVLLIKFHRVKIVFHLHGKGINEKSKLKKIFYRFCFKNEYMICLSPLLAHDIEDVYKEKIIFAPNGIPDMNKENTKKIDHKPIRLLFLSNLILSKGILDYIEALQILKEKQIDFQGLIVGAESDLTKMKLNKLLEEASINSNVEYLGPKFGEEKVNVLKHADMLVFPTMNDIWGNVNLEAMQFSLPVIATNEGAISEIIDDGKTGFIVDKNSPQQIADKIEFLIKNPEKRIKMGKEGRKKFLENYTIDKFEENMIKVFEDVLNKRG